jgi:hypothetical protein
MGRAFVVLLGIFSLTVLASAGNKAQVSQLPAGVLAGSIYSNDAVGVTYEAPSGWTLTADPSGPASLDMDHPDSPMNQCAKILLRLSPPGEVPGRFKAFATLAAIDPACFSNPPFPRTLDKKAIKKVVDKMFKPFTHTSFCSPFGALIAGSKSQDGVVVISLTGQMTINALEGKPAPRKEPLDVKTSFKFTEWNGLWVVWAYTADEKSAGELDNAKINFHNVTKSSQ